MENVEKAFRSAQARLCSKAAILMMAGVEDTISTSIYASISDFSFRFAGIEVKFRSTEPYDEGKVQEALVAMDLMIERRRAEAKEVYELLKSVM
jgi:hypothetical protein